MMLSHKYYLELVYSDGSLMAYDDNLNLGQVLNILWVTPDFQREHGVQVRVYDQSDDILCYTSEGCERGSFFEEENW